MIYYMMNQEAVRFLLQQFSQLLVNIVTSCTKCLLITNRTFNTVYVIGLPFLMADARTSETGIHVRISSKLDKHTYTHACTHTHTHIHAPTHVHHMLACTVACYSSALNYMLWTTTSCTIKTSCCRL